MAHRLDITNNVASFADSRTDAWHQLGQQVNHLMTAEEVMAAAHLGGWNVRKRPMVIPMDQEEPILSAEGVTTRPALKVPGKFATVRTNPVTGSVDYLGVVGTAYTPYQNEESCDLLNKVVDESGAHFETAGSLNNGRQTFVTMKLPDAIELRGHDGTVDKTEVYLSALNSHDGSSAFRFLVSPVRIVCGNTQDAAIASAKASAVVWHTEAMRATIAEVRATLGLTFKYVEEFERECAELYAHEITVPEVTELAGKLVKLEAAATDRQRANRTEHANGITKLFVESPTVQTFAGTRLGAYNAVTEYVDHVMDVRGGAGKNLADMRAMRTLTSAPAQDMKRDAFRLLKV
jgi:phage/plasmid-like protein (TIGR03299 family)